MEKIYIAGPISGTADYKERFSKAEEYFTQQGYDVVNPVTEVEKINRFNHLTGKPQLAYDEILLYCLEKLNACTSVFFMSDYKKSKGATVEYYTAVAFGKTIKMNVEGL